MLPASGSLRMVVALFLSACLLLGAPLVALAADDAQSPSPRPELARLATAVQARLETAGGTWGAVVAVPGVAADIVTVGADTPLRSASLYKLVLMVEAYRQRRAGLLDFGERLEMTPEALNEVVPATSSLDVGESISLGDAVEQMIIVSDNASAILVGERVGWHRAERTVARLGLTSTSMAREPVTTAADMRRLLGLIAGEPADPSLLHPADAWEMRRLLARQRINDRIPASLRRLGLVAHKTGDLPGVVNEAALLMSPRGPAIVVLMASDVDQRARAVAAMRDVLLMVHAASEAGYLPAAHVPPSREEPQLAANTPSGTALSRAPGSRASDTQGSNPRGKGAVVISPQHRPSRERDQPRLIVPAKATRYGVGRQRRERDNVQRWVSLTQQQREVRRVRGGDGVGASTRARDPQAGGMARPCPTWLYDPFFDDEEDILCGDPILIEGSAGCPEGQADITPPGECIATQRTHTTYGLAGIQRG